MEIALNFNLPTSEDKVTVMFGETNTADQDRKFRVGFTKPGEDPRAAHWSLLGWVAGDDEPRLRELQLEVDRGDVVRVERQDADGRTSYFDVDTETNWPAGAVGDNPILTSWSFED